MLELPKHQALNRFRVAVKSFWHKWLDGGSRLRRLASASVVVAAHALTSGWCYAQQASPTASPSLAVLKDSDGEVTKEATKVVEEPKPLEPRLQELTASM